MPGVMLCRFCTQQSWTKKKDEKCNRKFPTLFYAAEAVLWRKFPFLALSFGSSGSLIPSGLKPEHGGFSIRAHSFKRNCAAVAPNSRTTVETERFNLFIGRRTSHDFLHKWAPSCPAVHCGYLCETGNRSPTEEDLLSLPFSGVSGASGGSGTS